MKTPERQISQQAAVPTLIVEPLQEKKVVSCVAVALHVFSLFLGAAPTQKVTTTKGRREEKEIVAMVFTDEEQPLLRIISHDLDTSSNQEQPNGGSTNPNDLLDFDPFDPEDPKNWSRRFKWGIVLLLALMAFTV